MSYFKLDNYYKYPYNPSKPIRNAYEDEQQRIDDIAAIIEAGEAFQETLKNYQKRG